MSRTPRTLQHEFDAGRCGKGTFKVEAVDVDALGRRLGDLLAAEARHGTVEDDRVEGPALVRPRHLLAHGRQKTLRIEETRHPKHLRLALEHTKWNTIDIERPCSSWSLKLFQSSN